MKGLAIKASAPEVRVHLPVQVAHDITSQRARADNGDRVGGDVAEGQPAVGVRAHALEVKMTDALGVGEHALTESAKRPMQNRINRVQKRLELRLHLRLPDHGRTHATHDLEKHGVSLLVSQEIRV